VRVDEVRFVDTTLRDGQQSLWAGRMRAEAMLPTLDDLDHAGFEGIEFSVPTVQFPRAVKELKENPWDWLKLGTRRISRTPLRLHGSAKSAFTEVPGSVQELFLEKLAALGITTTRTSDYWNDYSQLGKTVALMSQHGIRTVANLIYSVSPRHTVEYYARKTREAAAMKPFRICFKDVGGLLTPEAAREVMPVVVANAAGIPLEFHAHCSNGFGPYVTLIAVEHGIRIVHTAVPPLADGQSQPSVFDVVDNLRERGIAVALDAEPLQRVRDHLTRVAEVEGLPIGKPAQYEERAYRHQVPGGMISNLQFQLSQIGMADRLSGTVLEVERVRAELGFPIMVTPLAQFVGSQAALNVITGKRYEAVTDEVIKYSLGQFGAEAVEVMDPDVRQRILDRPRAEQLAERETSEPSLDEVRQRFGGSISDEDLVMCVLSGSGGVPTDLRPAPAADLSYADYRDAHRPLLELLRKIADSGQVKRFEYSRGGTQVVAERR
jgi:oxaloacetate decarboxylase alpha subunit